TPEFSLGPRLRLGERIRASTTLHPFRFPLKRIVAVDIQTFAWRSNRNRIPVVVVNKSFGNDMIILSPFFVDFATTHNARIFWEAFPGPIRIFDTHIEN